jgi:hypothetical protein
MKPTKARSKPVYPADARRLSFGGLKFENEIFAVVKIKPEPKEPRAKMRKRKNTGKISMAVLAITTLLTAFPMPIHGEPGPNEHDLSAQVTIFGNYIKDFQEMGKSLSGESFDEANFLEQTSSLVQERLYATAAMLQMYDAISCKTDRANVRPLLKEQLNYSSWRLNEQATRTSGFLAIVTVPALATEGIKMRDDVRAAKNKIDSISAFLSN